MGAIERLGFIGVGVMGGRMCRNLALKSGLPTCAHDRDPSAAEALCDVGILPVGSIAEVMSAADLVFMCLPGEPEVRSAALAEDGLLANCREGQIIVDMSTATVEIERELAPKFAARNVAYIDAPVARGVSSAADGTLAIMVGGEEEIFKRVRPFLAHMGTDITLCGAVGTGQVLKLMNNMILFQTVQALSEAYAIGTRAGVDGKLLFETLSRSSADSFALRKHGIDYMAQDNFPDDLFPLRYSLKDLRYALQLAETTDVDAKSAKLVEQRFIEAIEEGFGDRYSPVIVKLFERAES